jgi:maltose/moltooligosaccharide transporter
MTRFLLASVNALDAPAGPKIFTVGTLRYTKGSLWILFSWLVWNDLCLMLMENVAPPLVPLMLKDYGASNHAIAFFSSSLMSGLTFWINPIFSMWSDGYRSSLGRRRPFLMFATPFCAAFLAAIPFMPDLFHYLMKIPFLAHAFEHNSSTGIIILISLCYLAYSAFNNVILAICTYYFWDVVPAEVLGRFTALMRIVSTVATFVWNYFLFGLIEKHLKDVFVGVALFFLIAYMLSLWRVREGEYPPAELKRTHGFLGVIRIYLIECFGNSYYLWFIAAMVVYQIGNGSAGFQLFYLRDQIHLNLDTIGKMKAIPALIVLLTGYPVGSLIDYVKPGRIMIASLALVGVTEIAEFFFLYDQWTLCLFVGLLTAFMSAFQISQGIFQATFFPRGKIGQYSSAVAVSYIIGGGIIAPFIVGVLFDYYIKDYRYIFMWSAFFHCAAVGLFIKVYLNWLGMNRNSLEAQTERANPGGSV